MILRCVFQYNSIGQGLFYTGRLRNDCDFDFSFVYDCGVTGTKQYLKTSTSSFLRSLRCEKGRRALDILVVSHFDADHVNGMEKIISDARVDTVVLPYISPLERLMIGAKHEGAPKSYFEFMSNPVVHLIRKGVKRIILINGSAPDQSTNNVRPPEDSDDQTGSLIVPPDDQDFKEQVMSNELLDSLTDEQLSNITFSNRFGRVSLQGLWYFKFYNHSLDPTDITQFKNRVTERGVEIDTKAKMIHAIRDEEKRKIMKECYNRMPGRVNQTSLVMYHGPVRRRFIMGGGTTFKRRGNGELGTYRLTRLTPYANNKTITRFSRRSGGTVLFGDLNLNRRFQELIDHYQHEWSEVCTVAVPHHGAGGDWNPDLLNHIHVADWVISFGTQGLGYSGGGHPNANVLSDIRNVPSENLFFCNERDEVVSKYTYLFR